MNILDRIKEEFPRLSKGQRHIADYILKNYDKAAYMTAAVLAKTVGISESTVVRFACALGYDGYPQMQKNFQEVIKNKLTNVQRLELMEGLSLEETIDEVFRMDIANLKNTREILNPQTLKQVVEKIANARTVYILGTRSSSPLAQFLQYYMSYIIDNVKFINHGLNDIYSQALHADERDVVIGISYPRYSKITVDGMEYFRSKKCCVVAITDNMEAPPAKLADYTLLAKSHMHSFVDSFVAPLSLINMLIILLGLKKKDELVNNFTELENTWQTLNIYATKEIDNKFVELEDK